MWNSSSRVVFAVLLVFIFQSLSCRAPERTALATNESRLTVGAEVLVPFSTAAQSADGYIGAPRIVAGVDSSFVVFRGQAGSAAAVYGLRLDAQGVPLEAAPTLLEYSGGPERVAASFGAGRFLLSSTDYGLKDYYFEDTRARTVAATGAWQPSASISMGPGANSRSTNSPAAAFRSGTHAVVQVESPANTLYVTLVDSAGAKTGGFAVGVSANASNPDIVAVADGFLVTWESSVAGVPTRVEHAFVSADGSLQIRTFDPKQNGTNPRVACSPTLCLRTQLTIQNAQPIAISLERINPVTKGYGGVAVGAQETISTTAAVPIAYDGNRFTFVHSRAAVGGYELVATQTVAGVNGQNIGPVVLASGPLSHRDPDIVWNGNRYVVVWHYNDGTGVYSLTASSELAVVSSPPRRLSQPTSDAQAGLQYRPRLAFDGERGHVSWFENQTLRLGRFSTDGALLDGAGQAVGFSRLRDQALVGVNGGAILALAAEGNDPWGDGVVSFAVPGNGGPIYSRQQLSPMPTQTRTIGLASGPNGVLVMAAAVVQTPSSLGFDSTARLVSAQGATLSASAVLATGDSNQVSPTAGWTGQGFLTTVSSWDGTRRSIVARKVEPDGSLVAQPQTLPFGTSPQYDPFFSGTGDGGLLLFEQNGDIRGVLLDADGIVAGAVIDIATEPSVQRFARAAFDSNQHLVVYEEFDGQRAKVFGKAVSKSGQVSSDLPIPFESSVGELVVDPDVVAVAPQKFVVSYSVRNAATNNTRVALRTVDLTMTGNTDAGADAGMPVDAGQEVDAGMVVDGGMLVDAGSEVDAGLSTDSGSENDAGTGGRIPPDEVSLPKPALNFRVGSSCDVTGASPLWIAVAVALTRRRRATSLG
jgi:hypothetical protein